MHKAKEMAVQVVARHLPQYDITVANTVYGSINAAKPLWWLEPANEKFAQNLFIILNENDSQLRVFMIPGNSFLCPQHIFSQRADKSRARIEIAVSDQEYRDKRKSKISFAQFLLRCIPLTR